VEADLLLLKGVKKPEKQARELIPNLPCITRKQLSELVVGRVYLNMASFTAEVRRDAMVVIVAILAYPLVSLGRDGYFSLAPIAADIVLMIAAVLASIIGYTVKKHYQWIVLTISGLGSWIFEACLENFSKLCMWAQQQFYEPPFTDRAEFTRAKLLRRRSRPKSGLRQQPVKHATGMPRRRGRMWKFRCARARARAQGLLGGDSEKWPECPAMVSETQAAASVESVTTNMRQLAQEAYQHLEMRAAEMDAAPLLFNGLSDEDFI